MRRRHAKPGEITVIWGRVERREAPSLVYEWRGSHEMKGTANLMTHVFEGLDVGYGRTLAKELESRGYDLTTLRFSVRKPGPAA